MHVRRFDFSLKRLLERYPEGCPQRLIAQALFVSEADVARMYAEVVAKLRQSMGVQIDVAE